jgi:hypothetical protein
MFTSTASKTVDRAILSFVLIFTTLVAAYVAGPANHRWATPLSWLTGVILMVIGFATQYSEIPGAFANSILEIGLLAYFTFMLVAEPLLYADVLTCSLFLLPLCLGAVVFSIRSHWIESAASLAFLYSGVAIVVVNSRATLGADGFLMKVRY